MKVAVVEKIFLLLETLAQAEQPMPLKQLTDLTKLPKPTIYRLLQTLQQLGYVVRHDSDYLIGHRIQKLASGPIHQRLKEAARPLMRHLYKTLNETVNLGIREGLRVRYVEYLETTRPLRMIVRPGQSDALFSTALGRAILSTLPTEELDRLVATVAKQTTGEKPKAAALKALLASVRKKGWSEENGETTEGVCCLGLSLDFLSHADAAVSVSVPAARFNPKCRDSIQTIFKQYRTLHE